MKKQVFILFVASALSFTAIAEDWPVWRGANRDGINQEKNIKASSKVLWKKNVGDGYSAVSVYKGKLLTAGNSADQDIIYCLNPETGAEIWKYSYSCPKGKRFFGPRATPVTDGDKVWMLSRDGDLICLKLSDGSKIWSKKTLSSGAKNLRWGLAGSPAIVGNLVLVNVGAKGMAFNKNTGKKVWANSGGKGAYATPMPFKYKGKQYVALFMGKELIINNVATGKKVASFPWISKYDINAADPIISADGQYIFASSGYNTGRGTLLKFNGRSLSKVWENRNMCSQFSSPVLYKGILYGVNGNTGGRKTICAMDFKSGVKKWRGTLRFGSLIIAGDMLVYLEENGKLSFLKINPDKEQIIKSVQVLRGGKSWTMPVLANGLLYCRNSKGDLVCLNLK